MSVGYQFSLFQELLRPHATSSSLPPITLPPYPPASHLPSLPIPFPLSLYPSLLFSFLLLCLEEFYVGLGHVLENYLCVSFLKFYVLEKEHFESLSPKGSSYVISEFVF